VRHNAPNDEVLAAWSHALFGVVPSTIREAFGVVALEAMAAGKPVIASEIGGLPTLVEDGVTGLLVTPGDEEALRRAMQHLLDNPELGTRMGATAKDRAQAYAPERYAERIEAIYSSVLAPEARS
jgi:glycosyltransferase involved in cell wall biosynthesis